MNPMFKTGQRVYVVNSGHCLAPPAMEGVEAVVDLCMGEGADAANYISGWHGPQGFLYWITQHIEGRPYRYAVHELELIAKCH